MGFFAVDEKTIAYLKQTGRNSDHINLTESYLKMNYLFRNYSSENNDLINYSGDVLELDLSTLVPTMAGPKRPQDRVSVSTLKQEFSAAFPNNIGFKGFGVKEENLNSNQNNNNTRLNPNPDCSSNAYTSLIDKNYKLMKNISNSSEPGDNLNRNNKLENEIKNCNSNNNLRESYIVDESSHFRNGSSVLEKDHTKNLIVSGLPNYKQNIANLNQNNERANIPSYNMKLNLDNIDITTTSIDPPSYRYVLKVPSIVGKSINSFAYDDQNHENALRKKVKYFTYLILFFSLWIQREGMIILLIYQELFLMRVLNPTKNTMGNRS
jgi:hypothetical protein